MKFKKPIASGKLPTFLGEPKRVVKKAAKKCKTKAAAKPKTTAKKKRTKKSRSTTLADRKF